MTILLAGAWSYPIYETACAEALGGLGVAVHPYAWGEAFSGLAGRVEQKWTLPGPAVRGLNRRLLERVDEVRPDLLWVWRGSYVFPQTLAAIREAHPAMPLVSHNNDDPFHPAYHGSGRLYERRMWTWEVASVPLYDLHLAYRPRNVEDLLEAGARRVELMPSYYREDIDRPVTLGPEDEERFGCDVVFVGHYEADGREEMLRALAASGIRVRLFGDPTWVKSGAAERLEEWFPRIEPVYGEDYVKALNGAKIALCFLSKRHSDPYTRRCFEIPACGTLLLSERTPDLGDLFEEGKEAAFFEGGEELVEQVRRYLADDALREAVAAAGRRRVIADGHGVKARMAQVKGWFEELVPA